MTTDRWNLRSLDLTGRRNRFRVFLRRSLKDEAVEACLLTYCHQAMARTCCSRSLLDVSGGDGSLVAPLTLHGHTEHGHGGAIWLAIELDPIDAAS